MFKNYLKIAFRNLAKYKAFTFINVFGLAIGMASAILILLWVQDELNYDTFNKNADEIYRVVEYQHYSGGDILSVGVTPGPLAKSLADNYPEVEKAARFRVLRSNLRYGDKVFKESVAYADPEFLKIFSFPLISGNSEKALLDLHSVLLTEDAANKYFGNENPMDKIIIFDDSLAMRVAGVMENVPHNSSIKFDFIVPFENLENLGWGLEDWGNNSIYTFVRLKKNAVVNDVNKKIKKEILTHNEGSLTDIALQPLKDIHLYSAGTFVADFSGLGNIKYVNIFSLVAIVVLLIACINFMNLSTARATKRAKEIGMRKVLGAERQNIVRQFYSESIMFAFIALILALGISALLLNVFNNLVAKEISLFSLNISTIIGFLILAILTGIIAGSYPSIYLSSFIPVKVLKSNSAAMGSGSLFRKILVVTQFSLSIILIIGTVIISNQLEYMKNMDLGFNRENVLEISLNGNVVRNYNAFNNELKLNPKILATAVADYSPASIGTSTSGVDWEGKSENDQVLFYRIVTGKDFIKTFKMQMAGGGYFTGNRAVDTSSIVINAEAAKVMGMKDPVGKTLKMWGKEFNIIGVIKNFNFLRLDSKIEPMVVAYSDSDLRSAFVRISPGDIEKTISYIEKVYKSFSPTTPFDYHFMDQDFENLYRSETRMQNIFSYFAVIAIIISCLGLFGLASYIAERRTKEIGIRKVLGANVFGLSYLLSVEFSKWVLISNVIAWPVAYFLMNNWLQNFEYRTDMNLWAFLFSGGIALLIALITVSFQVIKAATANPVKSLKYE